MKLIFVLIFLAGCWNDPDTYCYECQSKITHEIKCETNDAEITNYTNYRLIEYQDTVICTKQE